MEKNTKKDEYILDKKLFADEINKFLKHFDKKWDKKRFQMLYKEIALLKEHNFKVLLKEAIARFNHDQLPSIYDLKHIAYQLQPLEVHIRMGENNDELFRRRVEKRVEAITILDPNYRLAKQVKEFQAEVLKLEEIAKEKEKAERKKAMLRPRVVPEGGF